MKRLLLFVSFIFFCFFSVRAQHEKYSRVRIYADDEGLKQIALRGICVDHGQRKADTWLITEISSDELALLLNDGFQVEVLVEDVQQYYIDRNSGNDKFSSAQLSSTVCSDDCAAWPVPQNFALGTFAGFYSFQEVLDILDSMAAKYPGIISLKQSVGSGTTVEGRTIYYVKISDNPSTDEAEPEILYNSLHHAREPESVSQLIYFMWYLLENYGTDSTISHLIDNTELYFVPVVNPDGLEYNRTTNPSGGGMWRKNRQNNGDGTVGVDLNRNYAYQWGYNNFGSSPTTSSDTYRGPSAASEPETQLMADFINAHEFRISINNHCYGDVLIYPFGYEYNTLTPDSTQFSAYADLMTGCNGFGYGTPNQTVGYTGNGSIDDWLYADTALRSKIFSFTPEAGDASDGFWPVMSRIIPIAQNTMTQNMYAAKLVGKFSEVKSTDELFVSTSSFYSHFNFQRIGMEAGTFTVSVIPVSATIFSVGSPVVFSNTTLLQTIQDSVLINLSGANQGDVVSYVIAVSNGGFSEYDTVTRYFGSPVSVFADNCNSVSPQWTSTTWGVSTTQFTSSTGAFTESVSGNYPNNSTRTITMANYVDLTGALAARMKFNAKWMLEANYDYVQIQASTDGFTWVPLCGKYSGTGSSDQDPGKPLYDGFQSAWVAEEVNLIDYLGQNVLFRFRFKSDGGVGYDGFYVDDVEVEKITTINSGVSAFALNGTVSVQPNPFAENLEIRINGINEQIVAVTIYDLGGRVVYNGALNAASLSNTISLAHLERGMYVLKLSGGNKLLAVKNIIRQ